MAFSEQESGQKPMRLNEESLHEQANPIILRLRNALESNEGDDSLVQLGELLYDTFKDEQYTAEMVLTSVNEVYEEYKGKFDPELSFQEFLESFGTGLVKLCQEKVAATGQYDLGSSGEFQDGVDGKLGKKTMQAVNSILGKNYELDPPPDRREDGEGDTISPKAQLEGKVQQIYSKYKTDFFNGWQKTPENLTSRFGDTREKVEKQIIDYDPLHPDQKLMFLNRPIKGGVNLRMIPSLMIANETIKDAGSTFEPRSEEILGYDYRNMKVDGVETGYPSFHKDGLAIDIDPNDNGPSYKIKGMSRERNRGTIPDVVLLALADAGFALGMFPTRDFSYLSDDPMHAQLRVDPFSPDGQAIINASPLVGKKYWDAIQPLLAEAS